MKFKVGDNVRILNEQSKINRGTIDTIIKTGTSYSCDCGTLRTGEVTLYKLKNYPFYIFAEDEIELVKDKEIEIDKKKQEEIKREISLELAKKGIKLEDLISTLNKIIELITPIVNLAEENYNYLQEIKNGRKNI